MNTGDINADLSKSPPGRPTVLGFATLQLKKEKKTTACLEGLNVINDPKCNKVLDVITFCPKCNKLLRVITLSLIKGP